MFKLSLKEINGMLPGGLKELREYTFSAKVAYTIGKMCQVVEKAMRDGKEGHNAILKKYVELDEKGEVKSVPPEPALDPNGKPMLTPKGEPMMTPPKPWKFLDGKEPEYRKEVDAWLAETFVEVNTRKLTLDDFGDTKLTPECIEALEPVLEVPAEEGGKPKSVRAV